MKSNKLRVSKNANVVGRIQRNHIACAIMVWSYLKKVANAASTTVYPDFGIKNARGGKIPRFLR